MNEITISKGGITVTIYSIEVDDAFSNKFAVLTPAQSRNNQSNGPKDNKIVDLLRITRTIVMTGHITGTSTINGDAANKTASEIKRDLIKIYAGAGADGGLVTLNYDGLGRSLTTDADATSIQGLIEKIGFNERSADEPNAMGSPSTSQDYKDFADAPKFTVQITFLEGTQI